MTPAPLSPGDLRGFCARVIPDPSAFDETMINEAAFGLSRLMPLLEDAAGQSPRAGALLQLLEVGAGPLILSTYLACRGFEVTAVEPATAGFEVFTGLQRRMLDAARTEGTLPDVRRCSIEAVDLREAFDLVFTVNALEHMSEPCAALEIMYRALRPGGSLLVHCPNYDVPFDSHFGILLVGRRKRLNELIYRDRLAVRPECWRGLTFVRLSRLRRHCVEKGYEVAFNRGMLRDAFLRLGGDPIFSSRMPRLLQGVGRMLGRPTVAALLTRVPLRFQTPMEFVVRKPPGLQ